MQASLGPQLLAFAPCKVVYCIYKKLDTFSVSLGGNQGGNKNFLYGPPDDVSPVSSGKELP